MSRQKPSRLQTVPDLALEERPVTHEAPPPHKRPGLERLEAALADAAAEAEQATPPSQGRRKFRDQTPTTHGPHQRRRS